MKRLLWFICIPILLGALFLYLINHPQLPLTQQFFGNFLNDANMHSGDMLDTGAAANLTENDIFNLSGCTKEFIRNERIKKLFAEDPSMANDFSGIIFPDRTCTTVYEPGTYEYVPYYKTTLRVLDLSGIDSANPAVVSGMMELTNLEEYPLTIDTNLLIIDPIGGRVVAKKVIALSGMTIDGADVARLFVSFEGQDGLAPYLNLLIKKGHYLGWVTAYFDSHPTVETLYYTLYNEQTKRADEYHTSHPGEELPLDIDRTFNYYATTIFTNAAYQSLYQRALSDIFTYFR